MAGGQVGVVVAFYKEDLGWLPGCIRDLSTDHAVTVWIYCKHAPPPESVVREMEPWSTVRTETLPNLGRESDTYLHHIAEHHGEGGVLTVFLQGCISDHLKHYDRGRHRTCVDFVRAIVDDAKAGGISDASAASHSVGYNAVPGFRFRAGGVRPSAHGSMGAWYLRHFGERMPLRGMRWWIGALFCVDSARFGRRPLEFYKGLRGDLRHANPEEGHYMERAWLPILG